MAEAIEQGAKPADVAASAGRRLSLRTLEAFKSPAFTFLWLNTLSFSLVQGFQRFAFVWLVLELAEGPRAAGLVTFALGIPVFFLSLPAGVWSDRMDRRLLLILTQAFAVAVMALTSALVFAGAMSLALAFAMAVAAGATVALGQPVRTAILPALVPRERLMNAIVLSTLGQNVTMIVGPALGGAVIAIWGIGGSFAAQAVIYGAGLLALLPLRVPRAAPRAGAASMRRDVLEGMRFVVRRRDIFLMLMLLVVSGIFMMGPIFALLPQIAKEVLGKEAFAASALFVFVGAGMVSTSLVLATLGNIGNKGVVFVLNLAVGGLTVLLVGVSRDYTLTAGLMFVWGLGGGIFINLNRTLVQSSTPDHLMGRVMSIYSLGLAGVAPLGGLLAGAAAGVLGGPLWLVISGLSLAAISLALLATQPALRQMD